MNSFPSVSYFTINNKIYLLINYISIELHFIYFLSCQFKTNITLKAKLSYFIYGLIV